MSSRIASRAHVYLLDERLSEEFILPLPRVQNFRRGESSLSFVHASHDVDLLSAGRRCESRPDALHGRDRDPGPVDELVDGPGRVLLLVAPLETA